MRLVLDANVVLKLVLPEAETPLVEELMGSGAVFAAPDIVFAECANVLWRKTRVRDLTEAVAREALAATHSLFAEIVPSKPLSAAALDVAIELGHPAYDSFYVALASDRNLRFVTADDKLLAKLAASRYAPLSLSLADAARLSSP